MFHLTILIKCCFLNRPLLWRRCHPRKAEIAKSSGKNWRYPVIEAWLYPYTYKTNLIADWQEILVFCFHEDNYWKSLETKSMKQGMQMRTRKCVYQSRKLWTVYETVCLFGCSFRCKHPFSHGTEGRNLFKDNHIGYLHTTHLSVRKAAFYCHEKKKNILLCSICSLFNQFTYNTVDSHVGFVSPVIKTHLCF